MNDWSEVLVSKTLEQYEPVATDYYADELFKIFKKYLPAKHGARFQSVWCDGNEMVVGAADILANDLLVTQSTEFFTVDIPGHKGEYIRGRVGTDYSGNVAWISWGIGCPLDSGCDEILSVVYKF